MSAESKLRESEVCCNSVEKKMKYQTVEKSKVKRGGFEMRGYRYN